MRDFGLWKETGAPGQKKKKNMQTPRSKAGASFRIRNYKNVTHASHANRYK